MPQRSFVINRMQLRVQSSVCATSAVEAKCPIQGLTVDERDRTESSYRGKNWTVGMMRRYDFCGDAHRIDLHEKLTTTDRPCLTSVGIGPRRRRGRY